MFNVQKLIQCMKMHSLCIECETTSPAVTLEDKMQYFKPRFYAQFSSNHNGESFFQTFVQKMIKSRETHGP